MANIRLLLSLPLQRRLSVGTVDSFQAQERDIMAITLTRFDPAKQACAELEKSIQDVR